MNNLKRLLYSDLLKLKRTPFFILHLLIPFLGITVFLGYLVTTKRPAALFSINFYQVLTWVYPIVATGLCTLVTNQEIEAGGGFFLLSLPSRSQGLLSKLLFLLFGGLVSCLLIALGFHFGSVLMDSSTAFPLYLSLLLTFIVWSCSLFQYLLHTWIGLRFGQTVNYVTAAVSFLLSALLLTGLGEKIWFFFPSAWGIRLIPLVSHVFLVSNQATPVNLTTGFLFMMIDTLLGMILLFIWVRKWEGRQLEE
ncbi:lantibiotic immunity ABC transporter MutG family permease subunit [Enterococcus sp. LJL99]